MFVRLTGLFLLLFSLAAWADQLIIEPDRGRAPILDIINSTRYSLDLVMYGFTDNDLLDALIKQQTLGRSLKVILERSPYKAEDENSKTIHTLERYKIKWQGHISPYRLIHQKTLLIDDRKALVMTFNFTHSTFKNERNFALLIEDPREVKAIQAIFMSDWNHLPADNTLPTIVLSPENSREKLMAFIQEAKSSIQVYAQDVSDYKLTGALAKAARKGIQVDILTSAHLRPKQLHYLEQAGVHLLQSHHYYIHAKVMIFDKQKAVLGSINLTSSSLDKNRELSVVTTDQGVVKQLVQTFMQDAAGEQLYDSKKAVRLLHRILRETAWIFKNIHSSAH